MAWGEFILGWGLPIGALALSAVDAVVPVAEATETIVPWRTEVSENTKGASVFTMVCRESASFRQGAASPALIPAHGTHKGTELRLPNLNCRTVSEHNDTPNLTTPAIPVVPAPAPMAQKVYEASDFSRS